MWYLPKDPGYEEPPGGMHCRADTRSQLLQVRLVCTRKGHYEEKRCEETQQMKILFVRRVAFTARPVRIKEGFDKV